MNLPHIVGVWMVSTFGYVALIILALYFEIFKAFSEWFCSLYVMQSTASASLCLTWANTVATTTAACYSTAK